MKIASIIGARPQFIKVKPLVDELRRRKVEHILVHTGQHYDYEMSKTFFVELDIPEPAYNLEVGSHTQGKQTALMLERTEKVLLKERPDIAIVYGDTNSTLAGALAAAKLNIPVAHIEAGLRSYRLDMPEEINRVLTDHISGFLFCPTTASVSNLKKEGITQGVYLVGDVMYDIFESRKSKIENKEAKILQELNLKPKEYLLLTIHRQENTDNVENVEAILSALIETKQKTVFPIHPRTEKTMRRITNPGLRAFKDFLVIKPVNYLDMLILEKNARKVLTDSGGVQKEAYWFGIPCITLRNETEWVETVKDGCNTLAGTDREKITNAITQFNPRKTPDKCFGNGQAAEKIVTTLIAELLREC